MKTSEQAVTADAPTGEALTAAGTSEAGSDAATSGNQLEIDFSLMICIAVSGAAYD